MRFGADLQNKKGLIGPFQALTEPAAQRLDHILAEGLQALGTQLHRDKHTILKDLCLLNVGLELTSGMPLGKADIISKLRFLTASFANCHGDITFFCNAISLTMEPENTSGSRF
jgi:hypothetical protein